jgi:hypothetical protein
MLSGVSSELLGCSQTARGAPPNEEPAAIAGLSEGATLTPSVPLRGPLVAIHVRGRNREGGQLPCRLPGSRRATRDRSDSPEKLRAARRSGWESASRRAGDSLSPPPTGRSRNDGPVGRRRLYVRHVRKSYPEQRAASICHRRRHERARHPRPQLSPAVECGAEPGAIGHPSQSQDRRSIARSSALGLDPALVQRSEGRAQTD